MDPDVLYAHVHEGLHLLVSVADRNQQVIRSLVAGTHCCTRLEQRYLDHFMDRSMPTRGAFLVGTRDA